jgi:hypothetical protein
MNQAKEIINIIRERTMSDIIEYNIQGRTDYNKWDEELAGAEWLNNEVRLFDEAFLYKYRNIYPNVREYQNDIATRGDLYLKELFKFISRGGSSSDENWIIINHVRFLKKNMF